MDSDEQQEQAVPLLHREIPRRGMGIILVLLILSMAIFVVITPTCGRGHDHRPAQDMSNVRQILIVMHAFAVDHEGVFPSHVRLAAEYFGDDNSVFKSAYDHEKSLNFDATIQPGWYQYGSYWFLATDRFTVDSDLEFESIVLAYRTPRLDNDFYIVGFLDGHIEALNSTEFSELMDKQDELIGSSDDFTTGPSN